jgi:hypothetical protein
MVVNKFKLKNVNRLLFINVVLHLTDETAVGEVSSFVGVVRGQHVGEAEIRDDR